MYVKEQEIVVHDEGHWIPAFAGMTGKLSGKREGALGWGCGTRLSLSLNETFFDRFLILPAAGRFRAGAVPCEPMNLSRPTSTMTCLFLSLTAGD
jgi:hypothetical protein